MRFFFVAACAVLFGGNAFAQTDGYFQQHVSYKMSVRLDADNHRLDASSRIEYTNNSPDTLTAIYLHLYPNAYQPNSPFMRDYRRRFNVNLVDLPNKHRGDIVLADVTADGLDVTPTVDGTVAKITLPRPLTPGRQINLSFNWTSKVRRHLGRAGYRGKHYDFAQWYPKVAVYDENGHHPDQFMTGEFYGEFGDFEVAIDLPGDFVVAATGVVASGDPGWNLGGDSSTSTQNRRSVTFTAANVHDFAWCADPTFQVQHTKWKDVDIYNVYRAENAKAWKDTTLAHAVRAMEWLDRKVGEYPYPQVTVVDALLSGGMEYPMLVMDGRADESLVLHEIGHIYFYGVLANDEREEAWMDEGFTTFQTRWYLEDTYGRYGHQRDWSWYQHMTPQFDLWESYRKEVFDLDRKGYSERVSTRAEEFDHSYRANVYRKPALMLRALQYTVGDEVFESILRTYYDRWKLKHVNPERFIAVANEVSGQDLDLFFEQWLYTPKVCDYKIDDVDYRTEGDRLLADVIIKREGEMTTPLDLVIEFKDGSTTTKRINGDKRAFTHSIELYDRPKRIALTPNNEIADLNHYDNFWPRKRAFGIDWPNNHYYPEDAYVLRMRPAAWYNDVDGLKAGLVFDRRYADWSPRIRAAIYYGFESDRVDFSIDTWRPWKFMGSNARWHLGGYKLEGRQDATATLDLFRRPKLLEPPTQRIRLGWNYHELTNTSYLTSATSYDTLKADINWVVGYRVNPQLDIASTSLNAQARFGRKMWSGDFKYEQLTLTATAKSRPHVFPVDLRMRGFLGLIGGDVPIHRTFNLAGGGSVAKESRFYLRSKGSSWDDLNYHLPGNGNLRGYAGGAFGVNKLATVNTELGTPVPYFGLKGFLKPLIGSLSWYGFADVGWVLENTNPLPQSSRVQALYDAGYLDETLVNAGVGVRTRRVFPFWDFRLRVDVPFYVNQPEINGESDETLRRYLISLDATF